MGHRCHFQMSLSVIRTGRKLELFGNRILHSLEFVPSLNLARKTIRKGEVVIEILANML